LLAGKSASFGRDYDSFIGFILGTGTNTCYIESNRNILKNNMLNKAKSQIINIESGNFGKAPRTDIDIMFDSTTTNPGSYTFEKMISGGYFGGLCLTALKAAAEEDVFKPDTIACIRGLNELSSEDVNNFIGNSATARSPLHSCVKHRTDDANCRAIIDCLIDRAAMLVAANLAAVILKTGKGRSSDRPVLLTIEGTIYYKLHRMKSQIDKYLQEYLSGERQRYFEYAEVQNSSLAGAALAALID
jgi:hexokinase